MSYRDESGAALARVASLEDRVRELERENAALRDVRGRSLALARRGALLRLSVMLWGCAAAALTLGVVVARFVAPPFDAFLPVFGVATLLLSGAATTCFVMGARVVAGPREVLLVTGGRGVEVVMPGEGRLALPLLHHVTSGSVEARPVELTLAAPTRDGARALVTVKVTLGWVMTREALAAASATTFGAGDESVDRVMLPALERAVREVLSSERADEVERYEPELCARIEEVVRHDLERHGLDLRVTALTRGAGAA